MRAVLFTRFSRIWFCLLLAACSAAAPTSSPLPTPTATPTPMPTPIPTAAPTRTPRPTASPVTYRSSERVTLHYAGTVEGAPLGYVEYLPPGYGDGEPAPLIVFTHGSGESGDGSERDLDGLFDTGLPRVLEFDQWPQDRPFVVLAPQFGPTESHCTDADQIDEFLHFAIEHYDVDPTRVYLTGLSCGAIGSWIYLGNHTDELVAAAVLFAGTGIDAFNAAGCELGRVPIWAIHGFDDAVVTPLGSRVPIEALNRCTDPAPVDARVDIYPGVGHAIWQPFYDGSKSDVDIYAWMLEHTNPPD